MHLLIFLADDDALLEDEDLAVTHLWLLESVTTFVTDGVTAHQQQSLSCDVTLKRGKESYCRFCALSILVS